MSRGTKAAAQSGALLLVAGGILIAANTLSAFGGFVRKDMTRQQKYTLSKGSGSLLRSMKQELKADVYVTRGLPKLDVFVRDLRDLLQEYKNASGGKFDFEIKEAKTEEEKKVAKDGGLQEIPFGDMSETDEQASVKQGFMGILFKYGSEQDKIPVMDPGQTTGMEFWITNKIRELRDTGDGIKHKVGVLTGHDEMKLTEANLTAKQGGGGGPNLQQIITSNFKYYTLVDVDLKNGDAEIDDSLDGLVVTQPGKDLTEKELRRIDQFVLKGKSLAVFASAVNVKAGDAQMSGALNAHGLEKLLDGYGIEMRKDVVIDFGRSFRVQVATEGMPQSLRFPQIPFAQDDGRAENEAFLDVRFVPFFNMQAGLAFPFASSLVLKPEKQPGAKEFKAVARSTPRSFRDTTDNVDLKAFRRWSVPKGAETGQFIIGATVESEKLKSAFLTGDKMGVEAPAESAKTARVMVVSSSQFLANPFARSGNGPDMPQMQGMQMPGMGGDETLLKISQPYAQAALTDMILSFKNTLDWLTGDADLVATSSKLTQDPTFTFGSTSKLEAIDETEDQAKKREDDARAARKVTQNWVNVLLIGGLPLLFALFGVLLWQLRASARAKASLA
jgi:ABC-type uncharacterized transport system involved in gliding motility auxiliary subunit